MSLVGTNSLDFSSAPVIPQAPCWLAVYTYPRHERSVADQLDSKSVESFLPTFTRQSRWKDRRVEVEHPLFPGYVFARITLGERLKIITIPSVIRILSFNGKPATVPDQEIETIRLCTRAGAALEPHPFLDVGEHVRVRSGTFEGAEGIVIHQKNRCKILISIGLIQRSVALEVDCDQLERLPLPRFV
jgi:transcription antitermination factor NusG